MVKTKAIFHGCGKYAKSMQLSMMTRNGVIISPNSEKMCFDVIPSAPGELFFFREKMVVFSSESSSGGVSSLVRWDEERGLLAPWVSGDVGKKVSKRP